MLETSILGKTVSSFCCLLRKMPPPLFLPSLPGYSKWVHPLSPPFPATPPSGLISLLSLPLLSSCSHLKRKSPGDHNLPTVQSQGAFSKLILLDFPVAAEAAAPLLELFPLLGPQATFSRTLHTNPSWLLWYLQPPRSRAGLIHSHGINPHLHLLPQAQTLFWISDPHFHLSAKYHRHPPGST